MCVVRCWVLVGHIHKDRCWNGELSVGCTVAGISQSRCFCVSIMLDNTLNMPLLYSAIWHLWHFRWTGMQFLTFAPPTHAVQFCMRKLKIKHTYKNVGDHLVSLISSRNCQHRASCQSKLFNQTHAGVCLCPMKGEWRGWLRRVSGRRGCEEEREKRWTIGMKWTVVKANASLSIKQSGGDDLLSQENKGSALYAYCMCSDGVVAPIKEYF